MNSDIQGLKEAETEHGIKVNKTEPSSDLHQAVSAEQATIEH